MPEQIECPSDFAEGLADLGGYNYFGEPIFRLVWKQSLTEINPSPYGHHYTEDWAGFRDPCWVLQKWMPPEAFGTPELYYSVLNDGIFNRAMSAPYPEFGRYETVCEFRSTRIENDSLVVETIPLTWDVLLALTALLQSAVVMTQAELAAAKQAEHELREQEKLDRMTDELFDSLPEHYGPTSSAGHPNKTALIDRETAKIEQKWKRLAPVLKGRFPRGFFQN